MNGGVAAASHRTYFAVCEKATGPRSDPVVTGSRIYRFHLTAGGRITGYSLLPGGSLGGLSVGRVTASASGTEVAVGAVPAGPARSLGVGRRHRHQHQDREAGRVAQRPGRSRENGDERR